MDLPTIHYYSNHLPSGRPRGEIHPTLADCLRLSFSANDKVLDIGFSAGHATQFLIDIGCSTSGLYPRGAPADYSARTYPPLQGHLFTGDVLDCLGVPSGEWDGVVCLDVLQHLRPEEILQAVLNLHRLVRDGGKVLISIPHATLLKGSSENRLSDGRLFSRICLEIIQELFTDVGFKYVDTWQIDKPLNSLYMERDILLFTKFVQPANAAIYFMIFQEKNKAIYMLPLLRAIAHVALSFKEVVVKVSAGVIGIPVDILTHIWIAYLWPFIQYEKFIFHMNSKAVELDAPFVICSPLIELVLSYANRGGFETFLCEIKNSSLSDDDKLRLSRASSTISTVIINGLVQFSNQDWLQNEPFDYLPDRGLLTMDAGLWDKITVLSYEIFELTQLRWAELISPILGGEIKVIDVISLLTGDADRRDDITVVDSNKDNVDDTLTFDETILVMEELAREIQLDAYPIHVLSLSQKTTNLLLRTGLNNLDDLFEAYQELVDGRVFRIGFSQVREIADAIMFLSRNPPSLHSAIQSVPCNRNHRNLLLEWFDDIRQTHSMAEYPISCLGLTTNLTITLNRRNIFTIDDIFPILPSIYRKRYGVISSEDQKDLLVRIWFWIISEFPDTSITSDEAPADSSQIIDYTTREFLDATRETIQLQIKSALSHPIMRFFADPTRIDPYPGAPAPAFEIGALLGAFFDQIRPEHRSTVEYLWGIYSGEKHTLQETADVMGVTRERIRQKSVRVVRQFNDSNCRLLVSKWFQKTVHDAGGVLSSIKLLDLLRPQLQDSGLHPEFVQRFLMIPEVNLEESVRYYPTIDAWVSADVDVETIELLVQAFTELFSSVVVPIQWNDLFTKIITRRGLYTLDEQFSLNILLCLRDAGQVARSNDGGWVNAVRRVTREDRVLSTLQYIGRPAHFREVTAEYRHLFPEADQDEHSVHSVLQSGRFVRVGRGIYGLPEWGLHNDGSIANAAERVLRTANHPMTMQGIIEEILKTWQVEPESIRMLVWADRRFIHNPDGTYWFAPPGYVPIKYPSSRERLEEILLMLGHAEAYQRIAFIHNSHYEQKPLSPQTVYHILITTPSKFNRLSPGVFGLVEWDAHENA